MLGVITQREAAEKLGVRTEHVCLVLNGKRKSKRLVANLEKLCDERELEAIK